MLQQQWEEGDPRSPLVFDHREYWLAGDRAREIFAAAPATYAPVLGGDCIVTFADGGGRAPGKLEYGLVYGGRAYLFASQIEMQRFQDAPQTYADADLALDGRCPVASFEAGKPAPGIPAAAALFYGQRYLFASAHHREQFFERPERYVDLGDLPSRNESSEALRRQRLALLRRSQSGQAADARQGDGKDAERGAIFPNSTYADSDSEHIKLSGAPLMSGYCPVSCRDQSNWVRGRYDFRTEFQGYAVLLAGKAEMQAFVAAPERYMPALGGDCVVSLVDSNERRRGSVFHAAFFPIDPERGLIDESRLYLFSSDENKKTFADRPEDYVDADIAAQGKCVVTRYEQQEIVPGNRDLIAWHAGLRYFFAGEAERKKFLANPERYVEP